MQVEVKQEHIDEAIRRRNAYPGWQNTEYNVCNSCPVALAVFDVFEMKTSVGIHDYSDDESTNLVPLVSVMDQEKLLYEYVGTKEAQQIVDAFDCGDHDSIQPTTIELVPFKEWKEHYGTSAESNS